jgi:uncharacterized protein YdaU (DUF1376 family)
MNQPALPWFKMYARDFLAAEDVTLMSLAERGAYITMMCYAWNDGSLPADKPQLARLCRVTDEEFNSVWPALKPCFQKQGKRLVHPGLEHERRKALRRKERLSAAGKKGADKRWQDNSNGGAIAPASDGHRPGHDTAMASTDAELEADADPETDKGRISGKDDGGVAKLKRLPEVPW